MNTTENPRPPFPPFDVESAAKKVRLAEDAWNTREPVRVSLAYTPDSVWRNRADNDLPIAEADRKYHWPLGRRPDDHPGLSDFGL